MNRNEIHEKVNEIFRDIFDDEDLVVTNETNSDDIEDWDSLEQVNLLISMEKEFKIKFHISEISDLQNVGEMIDLIERKLPNA